MLMPRILILFCTAIVAFLGVVHLAYTFFTHEFSPTDRKRETGMNLVAPPVSGGMTMWKAWISFHVSHSMGLLLSALSYGCLTLYRWEELQRSYFLIGPDC
jgi:hypothetical protein